MAGEIGILNVGAGDTKLSFDKNNPAETIRAGRIVTDMLKRGYALLIEVGTQENGEPKFQRVKAFDENTSEYIIADFDPVIAAEHDAEENQNDQEAQEAPRDRKTKAPRAAAGTRRVKAASTRGIAVPAVAGG